MPNLVILPATEPDDTTYGTAPMHIEAYPEATVHHIRFPKMVWYNETVCKETIAQIEALGLSEIVLVGFSKSGLGVWHIARAMPERVAGTIIFDSPVVRYQSTQTTQHGKRTCHCIPYPHSKSLCRRRIR